MESERRFSGKKRHIFFGLFLIAGVVASLRGYEIMFMDLFGLISKQYKGRDHKIHPRIIVPLLGRFKGLTEERVIDFTLSLVTKSGFQKKEWTSLCEYCWKTMDIKLL